MLNPILDNLNNAEIKVDKSDISNIFYGGWEVVSV